VPVYSTPAVYFEWQDAERRIEPARTDIAGFVGIAERGPLHQAVRLQSWTQFQTIFGRRIAQGYLAYAVHGFFANGGDTCYVVRAGNPEVARKAQIDLVEVPPRGRARLRLVASSEGQWANQMAVSVLFVTANRFHLTLTLPSGQQEVFRNLSTDKNDPRNAADLLSPWRKKAANGLAEEEEANRFIEVEEGSRLVEAYFPEYDESPAQATLKLAAPVQAEYMKGGADGLSSLRPEHLNSDLSAGQREWGLAVLKNVLEVAIVAIPDLVPPRDLPVEYAPLPPDCYIPEAPPLPPPPPKEIDLPPSFSAQEVLALEAALIGHCEQLKDRVALLHSHPHENNPLDVIAHRRQFDSSYAAFYFPWLRVTDSPRMQTPLRNVPPCGHIAGIYARSELNRGVHKPPANEVIETAQDLTAEVDDITHGLFNDARVNVLRSSTARGIRVMGARTTSSDPIWRFMNVRRLLINIERGIQASSQWLPFETNNPDLWRDVDRVLRMYLMDLFERGVLEGNTPDEAFFVDCSITSNPPSVTDQGQMIALVGVRPPSTAEFIVVRVGRTESGLDFVEGT
jgi:hypothetical protein